MESEVKAKSLDLIQVSLKDIVRLRLGKGFSLDSMGLENWLIREVIQESEKTWVEDRNSGMRLLKE